MCVLIFFANKCFVCVFAICPIKQRPCLFIDKVPKCTKANTNCVQLSTQENDSCGEDWFATCLVCLVHVHVRSCCPGKTEQEEHNRDQDKNEHGWNPGAFLYHFRKKPLHWDGMEGEIYLKSAFQRHNCSSVQGL